MKPYEVTVLIDIINILIITFTLFFIEIRFMFKQYEIPPRDKVKAIEKKLEKCRNQENNPDSEV